MHAHLLLICNIYQMRYAPKNDERQSRMINEFQDKLLGRRVGVLKSANHFPEGRESAVNLVELRLDTLLL